MNKQEQKEYIKKYNLDKDGVQYIDTKLPNGQIRRKIIQHFTEPTKTKQEFKEECDINEIMKNFGNNNQLTDLIKNNPQYGDFSSETDFHEAQNIIAMANQQFAALPAETRDYFRNDPARFLAFMDDPESDPKVMEKYGLGTIVQPPKEEPSLADQIADSYDKIETKRKTNKKDD